MNKRSYSFEGKVPKKKTGSILFSILDGRWRRVLFQLCGLQVFLSKKKKQMARM